MKAIYTAILCAMLPALAFGGGAINFDGTDDHMTVPVSIGSTFTLSIWFKRSVLADNHTLFGGVSSKYSANINTHVDGMIGMATSRSDNYDAFGNTGLAWNHFVAAVSGTSKKLYLNGVMGVDEITPLPDADNNYYIGRRNDGYRFNGLVGTVSVYAVALTPEEVSCLYSGTLGPPKVKRGLVSSWSMENNGISTGNPHPNGSTIKDSVGSNDGTIADGVDSSMALTSSPLRKKRGRR